MKGIVLAGGSGTRLLPVTRGLSKQLLPIHDKPMIFYPISTLMLSGIRDILIISTPADLPLFRRALGDGSDWGVTLSYIPQEQPRGIAEALIIAKDFLDGGAAALILGDNVFFGHGLGALLEQVAARSDSTPGATIFAYRVSDPERYGVVEFDERGVALSLQEKPAQPRSAFAVTGLYYYDPRAAAFARELEPSARGEIEITDLNSRYLELGQLTVEVFGRGFAWLDTGTHDSLAEASGFVRAIEHRQGVKIACPEEIALHRGWISAEKVEQLGRQMKGTEYGRYLVEIAAEARQGGRLTDRPTS